MTSIEHQSTLSCLLCGGVLPSNDEVFVSHIRDHHRAYININLLYEAAGLDHEGIPKVLQFIVALKNGEAYKENIKEYIEPQDIVEVIEEKDDKEIENEVNLLNLSDCQENSQWQSEYPVELDNDNKVKEEVKNINTDDKKEPHASTGDLKEDQGADTKIKDY